MSYFTFQRIITFFTGIGIFYLAKLSYVSSVPLIHFVLTSILVLLGIYILIASLIPYKETTKGVAEITVEMLLQLFIEVIPHLFSMLFRIIANIFSH